ncbi:MAG: hypothetical protein WCF90_02690, partial [Methanomicrobiales archaeon]
SRSIISRIKTPLDRPLCRVALGRGRLLLCVRHFPHKRVPVPTLPSRNLPANPHYLVFLTILLRGQEWRKE